MFHKSVKAVSTVLTVALVFTGMSINAAAATSTSVLPSGGVALALANGNKLETIVSSKTSAASNIEIQTIVKEEDLPEVVVEEEPEPSEEETFKNLVIAQVNNYVNVRNLPSEQGEIVGKLYDDSVGTFISEEDGWYQIQSGSVTGYVKAEYCVTGEDAVELAKQVGTRIAKVTTTTLHVRAEADINASIIGLVPIDDELVVLDETDEWVQVDVEEGKGWVSKDYVDIHTEFVKAESKEEEAARLAKEEAERQKARQAAAKATASSSSSSKSTTTATVSGEGSEMGKAVAEYALQFVGNPYVYGGTSLTNGADCSGFVMSVYANFGVSLPHSSASDRSQGSAVEGGLDNAQPGDLICYSGHVALYIGNGQIVHASTAKTGIIVSNADYKKVLAVRRIF